VRAKYKERKWMIATGEVDIFSKGCLQLTFELLRHKSPELALTVRNITLGDPTPTEFDDEVDGPSHYFRVTLANKQVSAIIEELMSFTQPEAVDIQNPSINIMARSLMQDWLMLAQQVSPSMSIDDAFMSPIHPPMG
jgi:hypothetical protein